MSNGFDYSDTSRNNTTNYEHPQETNLLNLHKAMEYDPHGYPIIRVKTALSGDTSGKTGAFGETITAQLTPVVQLDAIYGLNADQADQYQTYTALGGTATSNDDSQYVVTASATTYSYGVIRSKRFLRYRPGQGAVGRFVARFTEGIANTEQRAGLFNQESSFMVGYNGTEFGILHSYDGLAEIRTFTLTGNPTGGSNPNTESATLTINGTAYATTITDDNTLAENAALIYDTHKDAIDTQGFLVEQINATIRIVAKDTATKSGSFTFSSSTATGSWATNQTANAPTDNWIPQSQWSGDKLDGSGDVFTNPSGVALDPTKFNVFQIKFKWLGAGRIRYMMEDPVSGEMIVLHDIIWANRNTTLHIRNPSMKIGFVAYNLGGGSVTVYGGSMMMAIEGLTPKNDYSRAFGVNKTSLSSNTAHHLMSISNPIVNFNKTNTKEIIIQDISAASQNNDPIQIMLFLDVPLLTGTHNFSLISESVAAVSEVTGTVDDDAYTPVTEFAMGINGSQQFELEPYRFVLPAGSIATIALKSASSISRAVVALVWIAD